MCFVCLHDPCDFRCPNAEDTKYKHFCFECGEGIVFGTRMLETEEGYICEECLSQMTVMEAFEIAGISLEWA